MAVRTVIAFDHLPQNDVNWINYADHGMTRSGLAASNTIVDGWLVSNATASGAERVTIPLDPYLAAPVGKIWIGIRCRSTLNARGGAGIIYFGGTYVLLDTLIGVTGTTTHLEFSYDIATGQVERWANGVKLANVTFGSGNRNWSLGLEAKGSLNGRYDWRDIVICDDQGNAQGFAIGPLGSQIAYPITLDSAAAAGWTMTPSGSTLLNALSEPGVAPTNNIATTVPGAPLTASLKVTAPAGTTFKAIELIAGARSTTGATVPMSAKISQGGIEATGLNPVAPITNYSYNMGLGVFQKAPNGDAWTTANIDTTDLILSPGSVPVNIANIQGYALASAPAPIQLRDIKGYVMVTPPAPVQLRSILGYAMVPFLNLPTGQTPAQALLAMILKLSRTVRPATHFTLGVPEAGTESGYDTKVKVNPTAAALLSGEMYFHYNRVYMNRMASLSSIVIGSAANTHALIPQINTLTGMQLTTSDIVNDVIPAGSPEVTLTAASTSYLFVPGTQVQIGNTPTLASQFGSDTILWS